MPSVQRASAYEFLMRSGLRLLAIVALWLAVVAFGTACFFVPRGSEAQPDWNDLVGFACSLAIAGAVAGSVALAIGGKWRLSGEVLLAVALVSAIVALLAYIFLWAKPAVLRSQMDLWSFLRLQHDSWRWAEQIAGFLAPLATGVGAVAGVAAGVLIMLDRRWPRLTTAMALALLFAFAAAPVQKMTFELVVQWGWIIHWHLVPGSLIADEISELAAVFGAIAGAVIAVVSFRNTRRTAIDSL